jgi:catechol 2,3-dioxygenase-like lactoylglutathione lyase family enzyme
MERWSIAPYFIVDDVVAAAHFYRDQLGFHYERFFGDPPSAWSAVRES